MKERIEVYLLMKGKKVLYEVLNLREREGLSEEQWAGLNIAAQHKIAERQSKAWRLEVTDVEMELNFYE